AFGEVLGDGFKFRDYCSIFGIEPVEPLVMSATDTLDTLLPQIGGYERPNIDELQANILHSLKDVLGATRRAASFPKRESLAERTRNARCARSEEGDSVAMQSQQSKGTRSKRRRIFIV